MMKQWRSILVFGLCVGLSGGAASTQEDGSALSNEPAPHLVGAPRAIGAKVPAVVLAEKADLVVFGRVGEISSYELAQASPEGGTLIRSRAEVYPEEVRGGTPASDPIIVEFSGGRVGDKVFALEDAPRFTKGDLVVLMLKRAEGAAHYQVVGMNQGYLRVIEGKVLDVPEALPVEEFLERIKGATNKNE